MNALERLAESEPRPEWKPQGEVGKALKKQEPLLIDLIRKGHSTKAIFDAWGLKSDTDFGAFKTAIGGLRKFLKREGIR